MIYRGEKSGAFLIDKPAGLTSFDVIARIRKFLQIKQVGHTGTLDPLATGLLVVLFGKTTRLQDIVGSEQKEYCGVIKLGVTTDTDDVTGNVVDTKEVVFSTLELLAIENQIAQRFTGRIEQTPPLYSAAKVAGKRSYALARAGSKHSLKSRIVEIYRSDYKFLSSDLISYDIVCSKGTYMRSLARDIGEFLGVGATIQSIRRIKNGPFDVSEASSLDLFSPQVGDIHSYLPLEQLVTEMPKLYLSADELGDLRMGKQQLLAKYSQQYEGTKNVAVCCDNGEIAGILDYNQDSALTIRMMF